MTSSNAVLQPRHTSLFDDEEDVNTATHLLSQVDLGGPAPDEATTPYNVPLPASDSVTISDGSSSYSDPDDTSGGIEISHCIFDDFTNLISTLVGQSPLPVVAP